MHIAPPLVPSSTVIQDSKPGRAVAQEGASHGIFDSGCLYWSGKSGVYRFCERAKRVETVFRPGPIGPLLVREQSLYFLRNRNDNEAVLSSFALKTKRTQDVARLRCRAPVQALALLGQEILVAGNCDPEMTLLSKGGEPRPFAHPDEQHPLNEPIEARELVRALSSAQGWAAWISQRRVYLSDPSGRVRRVWGQRDASAATLSPTELHFAHESLNDDPTYSTIIESVELKSGVIRTVATRLGHIVSMSCHGGALFFIQEPGELGQIDLQTGVITLIGRTPADSREVVPGDDAIYVLVPDAGVFAFSPSGQK